MFAEEFIPFVRYAEKSRVFIDRPVYAYDCRILYILEGSGLFTYGDQTVALAADTLLYYPAGSCYHIQGDPHNPLLFYTLNFDFDLKNKAVKRAISPVEPSLFDAKKVMASHRGVPEPLFQSLLAVKNASTVKNEIECIYRETESNLLHKDSVCSAYLRIVLCRLLRLQSGACSDETAFQKTLDYIRTHYRQPLDNQTVAAALNYHPNYLNAAVKSKTGLSLHRYIMDYRIAKAIHLLCSTKLSVAEIAELCGFVNANHFSACFRKKTGVSPLRYRKSSIELL